MGQSTGRYVVRDGVERWEVSGREWARLARLIAPYSADYVADCYVVGTKGGRAYVGKGAAQ